MKHGNKDIRKGELTLREAANMIDGLMSPSPEELERDYFNGNIHHQRRIPHPKVPYDI